MTQGSSLIGRSAGLPAHGGKLFLWQYRVQLGFHLLISLVLKRPPKYTCAIT